MSSIRRFACTQCGACCNRSPELELSEAAALADVFVFRLMFRMYSLPRAFDRSRSETLQVFYQKKRLISAHAARVSPRKVKRDGKTVEQIDYLMISALALDTASGSCAALANQRCSIHDRRPLTCRTVPLHYARADGLAERDLDDFANTPGYRCDTGESAPVVLESGAIVDKPTLDARSRATAIAEQDRSWKAAIVRRIKSAGDPRLPTLKDIEANAASAAMTTSMCVAWQIAADAGIISAADCKTLVETQLATIGRELGNAPASGEDRETLREMQEEYHLMLLDYGSFVESHCSARG